LYRLKSGRGDFTLLVPASNDFCSQPINEEKKEREREKERKRERKRERERKKERKKERERKREILEFAREQWGR
jgi:hypothetical protein